MKQILKEWSETDGFQYMIDSNGLIFRSPIGSFNLWKRVEWNYVLHQYQQK